MVLLGHTPEIVFRGIEDRGTDHDVHYLFYFKDNMGTQCPLLDFGTSLSVQTDT